jgi:tetratricopeptide (TPR) repeat protein
MEEDFDVEFTHGENGYLHLLVENGFAGLIVLLAALALAVYWSLGVIRRAPETEVTVVAAALLSGLAASIVHSFGDFVWYIPACLSLTAVIAACLCRLHQLSASETARQAVVGVTAGRVLRPLQLLIQPAEFPLPRLAWVAATVGLAGVAAMALANRIPPALAAPHWEAYFKLARAVRYSDAFDNDEVSPEQTAAMATHLAEALRRDPWHDRANLRMAAVCLRQFETQQLASENPMPLAQIRDAALASRFKSREAQDQWLALVMGENRRLLDKALAHARRALRLCPLHGDAYVYLAELAFLESPAPHLKQAYVAQATRVRPYSGVVLLAAGSEAAMAGDVTGALAMWTKAFHQDREQETQIIELLGPRIPASMFLEQFQPGRPALSKLYSFYHRNGRTEDARLVGTQLVAYLEREAAEKTGLEAAAVWDQASQIHEFLGDTQPATECARQAIHETPDVFPRHFRLATLLLKNHEYEEAVTELQWCVSRKPEDQGLKHQLELANRQRLAARSSIARH